MKSYRAKQGPFAERPYYTDQEIEQTCADELRKVGLLPNDPSPIRIERFIEKRFGVAPTYEDLPDGVLGFTKFGQRGVEAVVVARVLTAEGTAVAERRINTTLAHEAGHGLLQAHLFALAADIGSLFDGTVDPKVPKILCRDEGVGTASRQRGYDGRWWEFQANRAIGALLLPRSLVHKCVAPFMVAQGSLGLPRLDQRREPDAVRELASVFEVNPAVARLRIRELFPPSNDGQLSL